MSIREELKALQAEGCKNVLLNGFKEDIEYVLSLTTSDLFRVEIGVYETKDTEETE